MKARFATLFVMLVGLGIGTGLVQSVRARTTPTVYSITEIDVRNPVGFAKEYLPMIRSVIRAEGGHYVATGGAAGGGKVIALDGTPPSRVVVLAWDSLEKMRAYRASAEFKDARRIGEKYATFRSFAVEGLPD